MALYKFIEKEFLESFFSSGCLRLGTIHDFRDVVEHGVSRGDEKEGEHNLIRAVDGTVAITKDKHEPIISEVFKMEGEGESYISNMSIIVPRRCPNGFIFCTSYIYSENLFSSWNRNEGLDACYEISDVNGFVRAVSSAICNSAYFYTCSNVSYTDDPIDFQSGHARLNPALTKAKDKYSWQYENRCVWGARGPCGPLKPWIIYVPQAIKFCRPLAYIDDGQIIYNQ